MLKNKINGWKISITTDVFVVIVLRLTTFKPSHSSRIKLPTRALLQERNHGAIHPIPPKRIFPPGKIWILIAGPYEEKQSNGLINPLIQGRQFPGGAVRYRGGLGWPVIKFDPRLMNLLVKPLSRWIYDNDLSEGDLSWPEIRGGGWSYAWTFHVIFFKFWEKNSFFERNFLGNWRNPEISNVIEIGFIGFQPPFLLPQSFKLPGAIVWVIFHHGHNRRWRYYIDSK